MTALLVAQSVVLVVLAVLVVGLLRSHAEILRRLHAVDGGVADPSTTASGPAPFSVLDAIPGPRAADGAFPNAVDIAGAGLAEDLVTVNVAGSRAPVLLAFLSSSCMTCRPFWDAFAAPQHLGLPPGTRTAVVARDPAEESLDRLTDLGAGVETVVLSSQGWHDYAVPGSPYFVWVVGGAVRGEGTGVTWEQVRTLLSDSAAASARGPDGVSMEARIDDELGSAGIGPGHPSLRPGVHQ